MSSMKYEFTDDGAHLIDPGHTIDDWCLALRDKIRLFLARVASGTRTELGDYLLMSPRLGRLDGARVLWEEALLLASTLRGMTFRPGDHPLTSGGRTRLGPGLHALQSRRTLRPLADLANEVTFAILFEGDQFPSIIEKATFEKLTAVGHELDAIVESHRNRQSTEVKDEPNGRESPPAHRDEDANLGNGKMFAEEDILNHAAVSKTTFKRYLDDAGIPQTSERGLAARRRRFTHGQILKIRSAAEQGSRSTRTYMIAGIDSLLATTARQSTTKAPLSTNAPLR